MVQRLAAPSHRRRRRARQKAAAHNRRPPVEPVRVLRQTWSDAPTRRRSAEIFAKAIRKPCWREIALAALDTAFYDVVPACDHSDQLRCRLRNDPISGTESSHSSAPATAWS